MSWAAVQVGVPVLPGTGSPQIATFDLPITEDVTLAGAVTARLAFSCNEIDSYVLARLSRVEADGTAHSVSLGAMPVPPYLARNTVHLGGHSWIDVTAA